MGSRSIRLAEDKALGGPWFAQDEAGSGRSIERWAVDNALAKSKSSLGVPSIAASFRATAGLAKNQSGRRAEQSRQGQACQQQSRYFSTQLY
jgi:hypothetical protein